MKISVVCHLDECVHEVELQRLRAEGKQQDLAEASVQKTLWLKTRTIVILLQVELLPTLRGDPWQYGVWSRVPLVAFSS